jgi:hypothetical protein
MASSINDRNYLKHVKNTYPSKTERELKIWKISGRPRTFNSRFFKLGNDLIAREIINPTFELLLTDPKIRFPNPGDKDNKCWSKKCK